jgi:hypothetical protein
MSAREIYLANQIGELKARECLLRRCCRDYEEQCDRLREEIERLFRRQDQEGRESAPPTSSGGRRAA